MKMKTLLSVAAVAVAGTVGAVTTGNTLCRIEVDSGTRNTIVSIPLVAVASGGNIALTNLVLTTNLGDGTQLLHKDGENWDAWEIVNGAWQSATSIEAGSTHVTPAAGDELLSRGDAIWVNRPAGDFPYSTPFYIYGQVNPASAGTVPCAAGTPAMPAYTLLGNTSLADVALDSMSFTTPNTGDKVVIGSSSSPIGRIECEWKIPTGGEEYCWTTNYNVTTTQTIMGETQTIITETRVVAANPVIPAGQGFWYVNMGSEVTVRPYSAE